MRPVFLICVTLICPERLNDLCEYTETFQSRRLTTDLILEMGLTGRQLRPAIQNSSSSHDSI